MGVVWTFLLSSILSFLLFPLTGPDEIHYQMLKHLPKNALSTLLHIFYDIWATGVFPDSWRLGTVIPIPKPGRSGRVVRRCWVNFKCRGVLLIWIIVGQGPIVLAVGAGGGLFGHFSLIYHFSFLSPSLWERRWSGGAMVLGKLTVPGRPTILITVGQGPIALAVGADGVVWTFLLSSILSLLSHSLWETARYRLKYCLKGPLNLKQPTDQNLWETARYRLKYCLKGPLSPKQPTNQHPKPGKDHAEPTNYRPIGLTSCLCKTLERMINKRLVWYLESNDLISPIQSGFRSERSTNDHLIRLETFIRDALVNREHIVSVFFDLEKAYDTTWRYGILKDLHDLGLKGRLPLFIRSFLEERTMQVRVGSILSDLYDQEQGVPQGSILTTTMVNIKINNIVNCLDTKTDGSLYVDDFGICYRSKNMRTIERHLQQSINRIEEWATNNGFKFPKSKTHCVHFCKLRRIHNDPVLYLYGPPIPVVEESKLNFLE